MQKRWREPKAKPGELKAVWGKLRGEDPDICYVSDGTGVRSGDGYLLYHMFSGHRLDGGYLKELAARGYDLTTLRFSIQQKAKSPESEPDGSV